MSPATFRGARVDGNRAFVTLLFTDLCGYTALNETTDPEDIDGLRGSFEELAIEIIHKYGGAVSQFYGDGILAVFGFPQPQEDDSGRGIEAALELHRATRGVSWGQDDLCKFEVQLHSGVHSGLVFAREGDALHGRYDLTGDAVNTAARLCAAASADEILVSSAALRGVEAFFATESAVELTLKGKKSPVTAYRVTGRTDVRSRFEARSRRGLTGFVGRKAELEQLANALEESLEGRGRMVVVWGAAGIGKSRILEEFRARAAANVRVLHGSCERRGQMVPLEPFLQALKGLFALRSHTRPEDAALCVENQLNAWGGQMQDLQTLLGLLSLRRPSDTADGGGLPVERALTELLKTLSTQSPLLMIFDDWQWADDTSQTVLDSIIRETEDRSVCVFIGLRSDERPDQLSKNARLVALEPFREDETAQVLRALRPKDLDSNLAPAVHRQSGGNPLFVEELCRALPDDGLGSEFLLDQTGVPTTLQGVIQARVAELPSAQAAALRAGSAIGNEFSCRLLAHVLDESGVESTLEALVNSDLIYAKDAETFCFKHGVTRDVIYESVRLAERRRIHSAIAVEIERSVATDPLADCSEALAYHYRGSGNFERAATYAELAGDKAMAASALDRARFHYAAALADLNRLTAHSEIKRRWLAVSTKWALPFVYTPARDQLSTLHRAAAYAIELGDVGAQAQVSHWLGWAHYVLGDYLESVVHFERALELTIPTKNMQLIAQLWSTLGQIHAAASEYDLALDYCSRGLELKRTLSTRRRSKTVPQGFVYALGIKALVHGDLGEFDTAYAEFREALDLVSGTGHAVEGSILSLQCMVQIWRGRWDDAAANAARYRQAAERFESAYSFAMSSAFEGYVLWVLGKHPDSIKQIRRAVDWLEAREIGLYISFNYACLADALFASGDVEGARDYAGRALARARLKDRVGQTMAYRVLALINAAAGAGGKTAVDTYLSEAFGSAKARRSRHDVAATRLLEAELLARMDEHDAARSAAQHALAEFNSMGMHSHAERAQKVLDAG